MTRKNLYAITFQHLSQKDDERGIKKYLIATKEDILNLIGDKLYLEDDYEELGFNSLGEAFSKLEQIIDNNQDLDYPTCEEDDEVFVNYDDLYYGKTFYGYKLVKENISDEEVKLLLNLGIIKND